jgi:hypothetical protein
MSDTRVSRRTFLVAGGAAATSLAMGDALGRFVGAPEAAAGDVSGTVRVTEASVIQLALAPSRDRLIINVLGTLW